MSDIDIKLREMVLNGAAYQARELAHALDEVEWAELLDLLLDYWIVGCRGLGPYCAPVLTHQQCRTLVRHNDRFELIVGTTLFDGSYRVPYKARRYCREVMRLNPDIRARLFAEAAA